MLEVVYFEARRQKSVQRGDDSPLSSQIMSRKASIAGIDQARVRVVSLERFESKHAKVGNVLGDDTAPPGLRHTEDNVIRLATKISPLGNCDGIITTPSQLFRHRGREHLIEEQLHCRRTDCSRCHALSARAASSSTRLIQASISSENSA